RAPVVGGPGRGHRRAAVAGDGVRRLSPVEGHAQVTRADHPVLVVDDEKNIRRTLRMVLEGEGYEVVEAATADEAASLLGHNRFDLVLLDVKLAEDNGIDLLERLKRGELGEAGTDRAVPVIMISGHANVADAVRATREGAFDFLEKPLERETLVLRVRNA